MRQELQRHHALYNDLRSIAGPENVSDEEFVRRAYTRGPFTRIYGDTRGKVPGIIVKPTSTEQVSEIVKLANRTKTPVVPKGGGGSLSAFPPPFVGTDENILIDTTGMNKIIEIDKEYMRVTAECGIILSQLAEEIRKAGFHLPTVDVPIHMDTLGGVLSGFIGGGEPSDLATSGTMNKYLLGLRVVLPTGDVIYTGGGPGTNIHQSKILHREAASPDMTGMFIGDGGVFGIKTEATFEVRPFPMFYQPGVYDMGNWDNLWKAFSTLVSIDPYPYTRLLVLHNRHGPTLVMYIIRAHSEEEMNLKKRIVEETFTSCGGKTGGAEYHAGMKLGSMFSARQLGKAVLPRASMMSYFGEALLPRARVREWLDYLNDYVDRNFKGIKITERVDFAIPYLRAMAVTGILMYFGKETPGEQVKKVVSDFMLNEMHKTLFQKFGGFTELAQGIGQVESASCWSPAYKSYMKSMKRALDPNNILMPNLWGF
jgi:glycolate oxidase